MKYLVFLLLLIFSVLLFSNEKKFKLNKDEKLITEKYKNKINKNRQLVIVIKHKYKLYFYENKKIKKIIEIGLSQSPVGDKKQQGDNKLPEGEYYLIQKAKGPFGGKWGHYLGKRWIRISYPNKKDAELGFKKGIITLTWGCITMHNKDIEEFYDLIKLPVKILILK